jgi:hypothetical protein
MAKPKAPPKHLAKLIGDVVAFALHGAPEPKNLKKLTDWYEEDGWDNGIRSLLNQSTGQASARSRRQQVCLVRFYRHGSLFDQPEQGA